jgi:hypothetical protein
MRCAASKTSLRSYWPRAGVAIWGGSGKSVAFINRYGLDSERFPTVVDSDAAKTGTFGLERDKRFCRLPGSNHIPWTSSSFRHNGVRVTSFSKWNARGLLSSGC